MTKLESIPAPPPETSDIKFSNPYSPPPSHHLENKVEGKPRIIHFTTSTTSSSVMSPIIPRVSSPVQYLHVENNGSGARDDYMDSDEDGYGSEDGSAYGEGALDVGEKYPTDVYDATLSWWRAAVRRKLLGAVKRESGIIAKMQVHIRKPWLDAYFVYTSSLGTHTFFMTALPALFFFGYEELGRGLLYVLAFGVYLSSFVKDLFCSPRPFAPPVTRLTIGTHHLEYGFPSTHSTNSVSIALLIFAHIHNLTSTHLSISDPTPILSEQAYNVFIALLAWYTFSIVFGRLYTAMHSFTDCVVGVAMGTGIWWAQTSWPGVPITLSSSNPFFHFCQFLGFGASIDQWTHVIVLGKGLGMGSWVDAWVQRGGWEVPFILVPLCLLAIHIHPQPVDDCPCFEDAIAFQSVVLGALLGKWITTYSGIDSNYGKFLVMPGSGWLLDMGEWREVERTLADVGLWWSFAAAKMVVGILIIFVWRLVAKALLHLILPPIFRLFSRAFQLPNRRFYIPATHYKSVPSDFSTASGGGLRSIPSVIDLPSSARVGVEVANHGRNVKLRSGRSQLSIEISNQDDGTRNRKVVATVDEHIKGQGKDRQPVKHYDADVLTKMIVYAGIAVLACAMIPLMFEIIGWGIYSTPMV